MPNFIKSVSLTVFKECRELYSERGEAMLCYASSARLYLQKPASIFLTSQAAKCCAFDNAPIINILTARRLKYSNVWGIGSGHYAWYCWAQSYPFHGIFEVQEQGRVIKSITACTAVTPLIEWSDFQSISHKLNTPKKPRGFPPLTRTWLNGT